MFFFFLGLGASSRGGEKAGAVGFSVLDECGIGGGFLDAAV